MKSTVTINISVTEWEKKVVNAITEGKSISEISKEVKLGTRELEYRVARLKSKFQCSTAAQLVAYFLRNRLID